MLTLNKVQLIGRLTKEPELRKTQANVSVCSFTVACNREFKSDNGQEADFINCIAWRQSADFLTDYGHKGDQVAIEGRIQTRNYDGPNGKVYVTEVLVEHISLDSKRSDGKAQEAASTNKSETDDNFSNTPSIDISGDDLPFY